MRIQSSKEQGNLFARETPTELEEEIGRFIVFCNGRRDHEALGNVMPDDVYYGQRESIPACREKLKRKTRSRRREVNLQPHGPDGGNRILTQVLKRIIPSDDEQLEGLKDMPPIHKTHPQTTPPEVVEKVLAASTGHPRWGCVKFSDWLKLQGISGSSPTIQNLLVKHGMGSKYEWMLRLGERHLKEGFALSAEQNEKIKKTDLCFRGRHVESERPGELLCQDTFCVGRLKGVGMGYLQAVVDAFYRKAFREEFYESVESLQEDLDKWLVHYNTDRPHRGHRNLGRRPIETIIEYLTV